MLLPIVGNSWKNDNGTLAAEVVQAIQGRLPAGWSGTVLKRAKETADTLLSVRRKGGAAGTLRLDVKGRVEPKDVDYLAVTLRPTLDAPVLIAAPFLSPRTQERLRSRGFSYADLTGNIRLELTEPGLFIETTGARDNPKPTPRDRKSLKGAKAGRLVRALCDFRPPVGLREVAKRAGVDPGYASRVVDFMDREALVTRMPRGPITSVDWQGLLNRWSQEYSPFRRQGAAMYLSARGIPAVIERLKRLKARYAVTGSWAAAEVAPVAPPRLLLVYVDTARDVEQALDLRPADVGPNVALLTPFDRVVFERTSTKNGITIAAISQVAADLLTSPGRGPNEAEALMQWMQENQDAWRT
jgi:hypothetical protein